MGVHRKLFAFAAVSLAMIAGIADAQINEQDRLNRCQNNRDALARLQAEASTYAPDEMIARARTALTTIKALEKQIDLNNRDSLIELQYLQQLQAQRPSPQRDAEVRDQNAVLEEYTRRNIDLAERIRLAAAPFGQTCTPGDYACARQLTTNLGRAIDATVAHQGQYPAFLRQVEIHKNNLIALNCDQAGYSSGAITLADPYGTRWSESESGWSGEWVRRGNSNVYDASWGGGAVKAILTITISGNSVYVSRQNATDANNCQYQGTLSGNTVTGTYTCTRGGGQWRATIQ
jgi:hypothetical protein